MPMRSLSAWLQTQPCSSKSRVADLGNPGIRLRATRKAIVQNSPDVIVVPCWRRPAFLQICLEQIEACPESKQVRVIVAPDHREDLPFDFDCVTVAQSFSKRLDLGICKVPSHNYRGPSHCALFALGEAYKLQPRLVYYVEEDVFIGLDFFRYHRAVQRTAGIAVSIGGRNPSLADSLERRTGSFFVHDEYSPVGVCFKATALAKILQHNQPEYLRSPMEYCHRVFPNSHAPAGRVEQDGLVARVIEAEKFKVAWPYVPRCFHAGWYGLNRPGLQAPGPIPKQVEFIRSILNDAAAINAREDNYKDIAPCDLGKISWAVMKKGNDAKS